MAGSARLSLVGFVAIALLCVLPASARAQQRIEMDKRTMTARDAAGFPAVPFTVWLPMNAKPGRRLIVISHGSGAGADSHNDTVQALVAAGMIVATPQHPHDNRDDMSGSGSDLQLLGRPRHIARVLDTILGDPRLAQLIDPLRIGIIGYSAGGYTSLVLAGAEPDFALGPQHCARSGDHDSSFCAWMARGGIRRTRADLAPVHDQRIRAAVLMAPAYGIFFDRAGLSGVTIPLRIYRAAEDVVVRAAFGEERLLKLLPRKPEYAVIPGAGHTVFVAPCAPGMRGTACLDRPGVDRVAIHRRLNTEIPAFFDRTLGKD